MSGIMPFETSDAEKSYIERRVYDWLWCMFGGTPQGGAQVKPLGEVLRAYHTAAQGATMDVRVQFDMDARLPVGLRIDVRSNGEMLWGAQCNKRIAVYDGDGAGLYHPDVLCVTKGR